MSFKSTAAAKVKKLGSMQHKRLKTWTIMNNRWEQNVMRISNRTLIGCSCTLLVSHYWNINHVFDMAMIAAWVRHAKKAKAFFVTMDDWIAHYTPRAQDEDFYDAFEFVFMRPVRLHVAGLKAMQSVRAAHVTCGPRCKAKQRPAPPLKSRSVLAAQLINEWMSSALEKQASARALQLWFHRLAALSLSPAACCHAPTASNIYLVFSMIYARGAVTPPPLL